MALLAPPPAPQLSGHCSHNFATKESASSAPASSNTPPSSLSSSKNSGRARAFKPSVSQSSSAELGRNRIFAARISGADAEDATAGKAVAAEVVAGTGRLPLERFLAPLSPVFTGIDRGGIEGTTE